MPAESLRLEAQGGWSYTNYITLKRNNVIDENQCLTILKQGVMKLKYIPTPHTIGEEKKHAKRVLKQTNYDVVHIHLKKGEELSTHHAKVETLIIVRCGKVSFTVEDETVVLTNEEVLQMEPYEKHSLKAINNTDLLLLKFL